MAKISFTYRAERQIRTPFAVLGGFDPMLLKEQSLEYQGQRPHQHRRQAHAQRNGGDGLFLGDVQHSGDEGTGPGTGAGQGDAYEQHQGYEQTAPACFCSQLLAAPLTLFHAVGEKPADDGLVLAPEQDLSGKQVNDGHRQHIAHSADQNGGQSGQIHGHGHGNTATKLNQRHHGHQKDDEIFL